jgi:hypothetical protein
MKVRNLLSIYTAAMLIVLSLLQLGWTADYRTQLQPRAMVCSRQSVPPDEDYRAPQPPDENGCQLSQPSGADGCYSDCCCAPDDCCRSRCECPPVQFFGEYLYLRPRNAGVEYAVPIDGITARDIVPLEMGRTATVNPDFSSGFRFGGAVWLDDCTTLGATYSRYENNIDDSISVNPPDVVLRSMVIHPTSLDADADWLDARAHQRITFDLADIDYRHVFYSNPCTAINYLVGLRYASLKQEFDSQFMSVIEDDVNTQVNFDGGGFRLGLEAQRSGRYNFSVYGNASASFLGGEFRGNYLQSSISDPVIAQTDWKEARFVSILDCELGIGWRSCNGHVRASAGYLISSWQNVVKTSEFISSVQANKYHGPDKINGNGLAFDGFVAHVELGW